MKQILQSLRCLSRFKTYTIINLVGLIGSLSCALILIRYIHQEKTVDHFIPDLERLYVTAVVRENGTSYLMGTEDRNNDPNYRNPLAHPEVEKHSSFIVYPDDFIHVDDLRHSVRSIVTDSVFLELLPYPLVAGTSVLRSPYDAIITEELAHKIFGKENPIGKTLTASDHHTLTVVGVVGRPDTKCSITFDILSVASRFKYWNRSEQNLVKLYPHSDVEALNHKNATPMKLISYADQPVFYRLIPLDGLYTNQAVGRRGLMLSGNSTTLHILSIVVALLILTGFLNYINLHSVMMLKRTKELDIRKIYGAEGWQIFGQLYCENFCLGAITLFFIWLIVEVTREVINIKFGIPVIGNLKFDLTISALLLVGMPLVTSIYPFIRYCRSASITSLRGTGGRETSALPRILFLFLQYLISIILIIATLYFNGQLRYMLNFDLNFKAKDMVSCHFTIEQGNSYYDEERMKQAEATAEKIIRALNGNPMITHWTCTRPLPKDAYESYILTPNGKIKMIMISSDEEYMKMHEFKLKEGRLWNDSINHFGDYQMIINEEAQRVLGFQDLRHASVQTENRLVFTSGQDMSNNPPHQVIGVVEDFYPRHLSSANMPIGFYYISSKCRNAREYNQFEDLLVSFAPENRQEVIRFLKKLHQETLGSRNSNMNSLKTSSTRCIRRNIWLYGCSPPFPLSPS